MSNPQSSTKSLCSPKLTLEAAQLHKFAKPFRSPNKACPTTEIIFGHAVLSHYRYGIVTDIGFEELANLQCVLQNSFIDFTVNNEYRGISIQYNFRKLSCISGPVLQFQTLSSYSGASLCNKLSEATKAEIKNTKISNNLKKSRLQHSPFK